MRISDYVVVRGRANHVWLVLEKEDPFVSGGDPRYATRDEQAAWDWLAEEVAERVAQLWDNRLYRGVHPRVTRDELMASVAAGSYELVLIEVALD
jgi:hypothetical protein